ncbi:MAG: GyrI-like domain-containing protein [Gemmatimonadota bacterium]
MDISIVVQPTLRAATVRHVGPYPEIGKAFARLEASLDGMRLPGEPVAMVAIFHDNPLTTPAAELRSDAGILVDTGVDIPPGVAETVIRGGSYLHGRHLGSYAGLPAAWARLRDEGMRAHNVLRAEGPGYELYVNNPGNAAIGDLITDLYIPVVPGH